MRSKSSDPERIRGYLDDMVEAIDRIQSYISGMELDAFLADRKTYDAVVRNLEIIGEASKIIPLQLAALYTGVPWRVLGDLRNRVIHGYNGLSPLRIFRTAHDDLPGLRKSLDLMITALPLSPDA